MGLTLGDYAEFGRRQPKRGETIRYKTYNAAGPLGLGLRRGRPISLRSTGVPKKDVMNLARAYRRREIRAGRMPSGRRR